MYIPEPKETPSGWRIQLRINGQSIPVLADTPKECKRQAALIKAQAQAAGKPVKKCDLTLSQAIDAYIAERSNTLSPSTVRGYRIIQRTRFQSTMPRVLSRISPSEWRGIVNDELGIVSRKTVKNAWAFIKSVLSAQGIDVDNAVKVSQPRKKRDANWLEPDEIKKFVAAAADDPLCVPMLLALMSMRISEIDALRWGISTLTPTLSTPPAHASATRITSMSSKPSKRMWNPTGTFPFSFPSFARPSSATGSRRARFFPFPRQPFAARSSAPVRVLVSSASPSTSSATASPPFPRIFASPPKFPWRSVAGTTTKS